MSIHSYTRLWAHLIWETLSRQRMLGKRAAARASAFLTDYSFENGIFMKINYVNPDHVHALIDLPTNICIEEIIKRFKGGSSHWINQNRIIAGKFAWGRGYGAFSVSHSDVDRVARYIRNQEKHHLKQTYAEEYLLFVKRYGLEWRDEANR